MLLTEERALHEKIKSSQETVAALQEHYDQEIKALQAITSAQKDRHEEETRALREVITNLQNRHNEHEEETRALREVITNLQNKHNEEIGSLREVITDLRNFPKEQDRQIGQLHPRGVKRARADEGAPRREGKRQSRGDVTARQFQDFVDYVKSAHDEYKVGKYKSARDQRAFIYRFIDGIQDPDLSRWFQESLKAWFPDRVHDERRSTRKAGGGRIVGLTRDLTWTDVQTVLKHTLLPSMDD